MREHKVYLQIATPRSLRDPATRKKALAMGGVIVMMAATVVMMYARGMETADRFAITAGVWLFLGAIPYTLMVFNSYACIRDEELVYNPVGLYERRVPHSAGNKAVAMNGRIQVYTDGKKRFALPDSPAARELLRRAHISVM